MKCPRCHSASFCSCPPEHVSPGSRVLAPFGGPRRRGSWDLRPLVPAVVLGVEETPAGTWVRVEARGVRRRVLLASLRPVESGP
jgi:hypothetical protein